MICRSYFLLVLFYSWKDKMVDMIELKVFLLYIGYMQDKKYCLVWPAQDASRVHSLML